MEDHKILLTGDYWHPDFRQIVSSFEAPVTLVPIEKIESVSGGDFDLVVVAQSRRDQFATLDIEKIQEMFANTPVVDLLGSWCEGEVRSGCPFPGLIRVYWHQWQGRYENFVVQLAESDVTDWHAPRTSSVADRVLTSVESTKTQTRSATVNFVGISAWHQDQYEMLADAARSFGWKPCWVERAVWDAESSSAISVVCIEADSWSPNVRKRVDWIRSEIPATPMVLILNYPRADELESIHAAGISKIVSKPFELIDLKSAILNVESIASCANDPCS